MNPGIIFTPWGRGHAAKANWFTDEQIVFSLKRAELGTKIDEGCRRLGISDATFYK
jgi:putative transposase